MQIFYYMTSIRDINIKRVNNNEACFFQVIFINSNFGIKL